MIPLYEAAITITMEAKKPGMSEAVKNEGQAFSFSIVGLVGMFEATSMDPHQGLYIFSCLKFHLSPNVAEWPSACFGPGYATMNAVPLPFKNRIPGFADIEEDLFAS